MTEFEMTDAPDSNGLNNPKVMQQMQTHVVCLLKAIYDPMSTMHEAQLALEACEQVQKAVKEFPGASWQDICHRAFGETVAQFPFNHMRLRTRTRLLGSDD